MKIANLLKIIVFTISLSSCKNQNEKITNTSDYNTYLNISENKNIGLAEKEIEFWQKKYNASPNQTSYLIQLAGYYTSLFETTFEVNHLYKAEELLLKVNSYFNYSGRKRLSRPYWTRAGSFSSGSIIRNQKPIYSFP